MAGTGNPELDREVDRMNSRLQQALSLASQLSELSGDAESQDGYVQVSVDSSGILSSLSINPRAMKQGSETLAEQIMETVKAAQESLARESQELVKPLLGDVDRYREMLTNGSLQDVASTATSGPADITRAEDPLRAATQQFERIQQMMGMDRR